MKKAIYFLSFDSLDTEIARLVLAALRLHSPDAEFFWTGETLMGGTGWFAPIEDALQKATGLISLITNNQAGSNPWINFEIGAAVGKSLYPLAIMGPDVDFSTLSKPLSNLQFVTWSDLSAIEKGLTKLGLCQSREGAISVRDALQPPEIIECYYGTPENLYKYTAKQRVRLRDSIKRFEKVQVGNHLIDDIDPAPNKEKILNINLERNGSTYTKSLKEENSFRRSDLYK